MRIVHAALRMTGPATDADAFVDAHASEVGENALSNHYTRERIVSAEAKRQFLEPDKAPLPGSEPTLPEGTKDPVSRIRTIVQWVSTVAWCCSAIVWTIIICLAFVPPPNLNADPGLWMPPAEPAILSTMISATILLFQVIVIEPSRS